MGVDASAGESMEKLCKALEDKHKEGGNADGSGDVNMG